MAAASLPVKVSICARACTGSASTRMTRARSAASGLTPWPSSLAASAFSHSRVCVSASAAGLAARQPHQRGRHLGARQQLLVVGGPGIEGQQLPLVGRQRLAGQRVGQHGLHRPAAGQAELQHRHHLRRVGLARQAGDLGAVGREQHHRRVAADLEAAAELLRAGAVAVHVHGDEALRQRGEILAVEEGGLELVARRAPGGAPVQQHRLVLGAGLGEGALDIGVGGGGQPGHVGGRQAGGGVGRQHREPARHQQRGSEGKVAVGAQRRLLSSWRLSGA